MVSRIRCLNRQLLSICHVNQGYIKEIPNSRLLSFLLGTTNSGRVGERLRNNQNVSKQKIKTMVFSITKNLKKISGKGAFLKN